MSRVHLIYIHDILKIIGDFNMSEPRRWWIDPDDLVSVFSNMSDDIKLRCICVVTAKAYDELKAKYKALENDAGQLAHNSTINLGRVLNAAKEEIEKEKKCHSLAKLACEQLIKERTTYRTIDSLLGDNGEICELHDDIEALEAKCEDYKTQCEKLLEYLKDVIRNSSDILAKKHCSNGLAEHETWLKEQK